MDGKNELESREWLLTQSPKFTFKIPLLNFSGKLMVEVYKGMVERVVYEGPKKAATLQEEDSSVDGSSLASVLFENIESIGNSIFCGYMLQTALLSSGLEGEA